MDEEALARLRDRLGKVGPSAAWVLERDDVAVLLDVFEQVLRQEAVIAAARAYRAAYDADTDEEERAARRALDEALAALDGNAPGDGRPNAAVPT